MTGQEFREARGLLGLSYREMAEALGLSAAGRRAVRRWEAEGPPSRIAERVRAMLQIRSGEGEGDGEAA